jgi:hypothetical protein
MREVADPIHPIKATPMVPTPSSTPAVTKAIAVDAEVGQWRVLRVAYRRALCRCRCGSVHEVAVSALESGASRSCGCAPMSLISRRAFAEFREERQRRQERGRW